MTATVKAVWARQVTGHRHLTVNLSSLKRDNYAKGCLSGCLGPGPGWGGTGFQSTGHSRLSAKHTRLECATSAIIMGSFRCLQAAAVNKGLAVFATQNLQRVKLPVFGCISTFCLSF